MLGPIAYLAVLAAMVGACWLISRVVPLPPPFDFKEPAQQVDELAERRAIRQGRTIGGAR